MNIFDADISKLKVLLLLRDNIEKHISTYINGIIFDKNVIKKYTMYPMGTYFQIICANPQGTVVTYRYPCVDELPPEISFIGNIHTFLVGMVFRINILLGNLNDKTVGTKISSKNSNNTGRIERILVSPSSGIEFLVIVTDGSSYVSYENFIKDWDIV